MFRCNWCHQLLPIDDGIDHAIACMPEPFKRLLNSHAPPQPSRRLESAYNNTNNVGSHKNKSTQTEENYEKKPKKKWIPKGALQILRDAAEAEIKQEEESVPEKKTEEPKSRKDKKKPKTHFRKSKKPGRA